MSKGVVTHLAVFTFIFIISGQIYGAVLTQEVFSEEISYHTGGINDIAEARIRGDLYLDRINKELNYSSNIVAVNLAATAGGTSWSNQIPDKSDLKQLYASNILEEIETQNQLYQCTPPALESVTISEETRIKLDFVDSENAVTCRSGVSGSGDISKVYLEKDHVTIETSKNRYIPISSYAVELARKAEEKMPGSELTGSDTETSECPGDRQSTIRTAKNNARDSAVSGYRNIASEGYSETSGERPEYVTTSTKTTNFEDEYDVTVNSEQCTYYVDCSKDLDGDGEPDITQCPKVDTEYEATAEYTVTGITTSYDLQDSENQILTNEGGKTISFSFSYFNDLSN